MIIAIRGGLLVPGRSRSRPPISDFSTAFSSAFRIAPGSYSSLSRADSAVFALIGGAARVALVAPATAGAIFLTGGAVGFSHGQRIVSAGSGAFALAGMAIGLGAGLSAASRAFVLTGRDAALDYFVTKHIFGAPGSFALTGRDAGLNVNEPAGSNSFALTGYTAGMDIIEPAGSGSFALTGRAASAIHIGKLAAASRAFVLTGNDASEAYSGRFAVDWNLTTSMPAQLAFARASSATRWNSAGTLVSEGTNVARFDYDPGTGTLRGLLNEPAATNYQFASADFTDGTVWGLASGASTAGSWTAPDGTSGFSFSPNGTSGASLGSIHSHHGLTSGSTYTTSVHAKAVTGRYQWLSQTERNGNGGVSAVFDLAGTSDTVATQVITWGTNSATVASTAAKYLGGGVWRLSITWSMTLSGDSVYTNMGAADSGTGNTRISGWSLIASTNSNQAGFWGIQLEAGSVATSFIYTTATATASRSVDILSSTNAGLLAVRGWIIETGELLPSTTATLLGINTGIALGKTSGDALTTADGGNQTTGNTATWTGVNKSAIAWDATARVSICLNGGTVATAANTANTPTALYFGNTNNGASGTLTGHIRKITSKASMTDADLVTFTT